MKKILLLLLVFTFFYNQTKAQHVDSIRVEQAGDFIKIFYRITGSNQNQTFRVSLLASINEGLRSELKSVSGDLGENIVGGKNEYWIIWDVLKDVDELNSVEFFVKAELSRDLSAPVKQDRSELTMKWQKKRFTIMPAVALPGPRIGGTIGFNGSFGLLGSITMGNIAEPEAISVGPGSFVDESDHEGVQFSIHLTKRIISIEAFQVHLAAGYSVAEMIYSVTDDANPENFRHDKVFTRGLSAGLLFGAGRLTGAAMFMKYDPGSVEQSNEGYYLITPMNLFTVGLGVRF
jgi:hypothetical protein